MQNEIDYIPEILYVQAPTLIDLPVAFVMTVRNVASLFQRGKRGK